MQSQNASQNSSPCQTVGSLTQGIVKNAADSAMTRPNLPTSSETITPPAAPTSSAGMQLSTLGSATLRDLAVAAVEGRTGILTDANLKILLESHFGQRCDVQARTTYGTDEKPGFRTLGYQVTICRDEGDEKVEAWLQGMNRPVKPDFLAGKLARMRVMLARRGESDRDVSLLIDTMMDLLGKYPADAIAEVTEEWLVKEKFFPKASEFIELLEEKVALRRAILAALNPPTALPRPARAPETYKTTQRATWDKPMWEAYILDAEKMLALAQQNPTFMDAASWEVEIVKRKAALPAEFGGAMRSPEAGATQQAASA